MSEYESPCFFDKSAIKNLSSLVKGVYYLGYLNTQQELIPLYIGKATGAEGIKGRLLDHIENNQFNDITHFEYIETDNEKEALIIEEIEIKKHNPKYNNQHNNQA